MKVHENMDTMITLQAPQPGGNGLKAWAGRAWSAPLRLCRSGWARLYRWQAGTMARAHLRQLDQAALGDVGLSRQQADREAGKTVWHR